MRTPRKYDEYSPPNTSEFGENRSVDRPNEFSSNRFYSNDFEPTKMSEEFPKPAPEIVEPGKFVWEPKKKKKQARELAYQFVSGFIALTLLFGLLPGFRAEANLNNQAEENSEFISSEIENSEEQNMVMEEPVQDESEPEKADSENIQEESSESSDLEESEENQEQNIEESEESEPVVYMEPECDPVVYAFYSEMHGTIYFSDMESVTNVRLDVVDILTESIEESRDITKEAVEDGVYFIDPFYTDFIYENHAEEYAAAMDFPMQVRFDIFMTYMTEEGEETKLVSAVTTSEDDNMIFVKYLPYDEMMGDSSSKFIAEITSETGEDIIVYNDESAVREGVSSIRILIDGKDIDFQTAEISKFQGNVFDDEGNSKEMTYIDYLIPKPEWAEESEDTKVIIELCYYLPSYGRIVKETLHTVLADAQH